eukprot:174633-Prorocentrum_lima.AAC.1
MRAMPAAPTTSLMTKRSRQRVPASRLCAASCASGGPRTPPFLCRPGGRPAQPFCRKPELAT